MFKNEKLSAIVAALQCSHPHYLGEDYYLSVSYESPRGFRVLFFMEDFYKTFITDYQFEVFAAVARLFQVNVSMKVCNGVPVVCMFTGSY